MKHKYETNVQKTLDCRQNKCSLQIFNTHFLNFECDFCNSFSMLFPKAPVSCGKKIK